MFARKRLAALLHYVSDESDSSSSRYLISVLRKILISLRILIWWRNRYNC